MSAGVKSVEFDSSGVLVWVGDEKVQSLIPYVRLEFRSYGEVSVSRTARTNI